MKNYIIKIKGENKMIKMNLKMKNDIYLLKIKGRHLVLRV